jgi:spoIIIJ-associated protein
MNDKKPMDEALDTFVKSLKEDNKKERAKKKNQDETRPKEGIDGLLEFTKNIVAKVCESEDVEIKYDEEKPSIALYGKDISIMIGKEGRNITALEHIINLAGKRKQILKRNIVLDIKDYRKNNLEKVKKIAHKMAEKAVKEGRKIALRPMPSFERKTIHNSLSEMKNVRTASKDEEPNRRVIIYPVINEQ